MEELISRILASVMGWVLAARPGFVAVASSAVKVQRLGTLVDTRSCVEFPRGSSEVFVGCTYMDGQPRDDCQPVE